MYAGNMIAITVKFNRKIPDVFKGVKVNIAVALVIKVMPTRTYTVLSTLTHFVINVPFFNNYNIFLSHDML